ncbi:sarcosine oxidase subunit gamma [Nisaea acidiphila]|uniref:Sarcosine oxidase subunit gamma n=1 Tax=Nisaea acidiphila TaxID=1862145 RepID=A0A9J7AQ63_9PROT|nr:sarcosine oxidase subunit gamma family protein [Nisaea acidiphila]UUX48737.1 sarcosine oxidase subunit gamma [Nisaea acidiphila]
MADLADLKTRSALAPLDIIHGGPADAGVVLTEIPFRSKLVLRGHLSEKAFVSAIKSVLGAVPPAEANTVAATKDVRILWTGPDEWMVYGDDTELAGKLATALDGQHAAVTEVTEHHTMIRLSGRHARDVMAKGCAIDLHPREFGAGRCTQSHIGRITVLFDQIDETPTYDILVRASFAEYLWTYLEDAGLEFGVRIENLG